MNEEMILAAIWVTIILSLLAVWLWLIVAFVKATKMWEDNENENQ